MHANLPIITSAPNVHFERIGGTAGIVRLVDAFYRAMDTRADARAIRAMHGADLASTKAVLVKYLGEWMGGARSYSAERGAPMLRRRHQPFDIDERARDAWMACMRQALAETCSDTALTAELDAAFWKIADHIRNAVAPVSDSHPLEPR
ncbi:MAG TPA: group II truncated hemoglobin [Albitalea sp.]|nr:group II truncated hemoglobin [Albitalea sp.]